MASSRPVSPPPAYSVFDPSGHNHLTNPTNSSHHHRISSKESGSIAVIMLIVSIALWTVGTSQSNLSMVLAGKILTGLSLAPLTLAIAAICALPLIYCLGTHRLSRNSARH